ncbi:MAG: hypothetical protein H6742_19865 [Alphaproteobacteria bacterium]|nr:hypothetical protein [Alphaproteobacteria bacterium]
MLALIALGLPALAFSPDADTHIGVEPTRVYRTHLEVQRLWRNGAAWQAFVDGDGQGWQARFDERTGLPLSAWGPPILLGQLDSAQAVDAALYDFFSRNPGLIGVPVDELALRAVHFDEARQAWSVQLAHVVSGPQADAGGFDPGVDTDAATALSMALDPLGIGGALADDAIDFTPVLDASGVDVWRGGVQVFVRNGAIQMIQVQTHPGAADVQDDPVVGAPEAVEVAIADGPEPAADHQVEGARLVVLPIEKWGIGVDAPFGQTGTGLDYVLAWEVRTRTTAPVGLWVGFVDATTGELLHVYNEVRYVQGTVSGQHDVRTVDGEMMVSPLPNLRVSSGSSSVYTDVDGAYDISGSTATAELRGSQVRVVNNTGGEGELDLTGGDQVFKDDDATQAEIDSYVFLEQVIDWKQTHAPDVRFDGVLRSNVNLNSTCNAYFDGSVNFYKSGDGCNNTGRIADVNYHEWGHGFHYYSLTSGSFDGSMSEGIADVVAFFMTGDSTIAPYFMTNGSGIRDVAPNRSYPGDVTGEVHADGLIYAGAVWDLWDLLEDEYGADVGYETAIDIFAQGIKSGPTLANAYDATVLGDDDDNDLSNGTPHQCLILEAFQAHGLSPAGGEGALMLLDHEALGNQPVSASEYAISGDLLNLAPECNDFSLAEGLVHYSTDGGETWATAPLTAAGEGVQGAIPAQPAGTVVHYYLTAKGADGTEVGSPSGKSINPYSFVVGEMVQLYCEDFEADDGGYLSELLDGADELGANDWMWGTPRGMGGDPDFAFSGDKVWGNDLGGGNYNGEYQNDKHNRLSSTGIDVSGHDTVVLQFRRWLNVEDGYWDHARVVMVGADDGDDRIVWANFGSSGGESVDHEDHHQDDQWTLHSQTLDVAGMNELIVGWDIVSDGGLTFGGWTIDDVCVYAVEGAENPGDGGNGGSDSGLGGADAGADGGDDWTVEKGGCSCSASPAAAPGFGLAGLALGLLALVRRRK